MNADTPVLVLGGRGFVGSQITRRLIRAGRHPHLFGPPMEHDVLADVAGRFTESHGSVEDRAAIFETLKESGARTIVSTAAHSVGDGGLMRSGEAESDQALAVNVLGFGNVLEAARAGGVESVVWTSSTVVYGAARDYPQQPVDEEAPRRPLTFYGLTKQMAEDVADYHRNRFSLDVVGLRLPLVLGPGLWYRGAAAAIMDVIRAAADNRPHRAAFHNDAMDLMHVVDVADAVLAVIAAPRQDRSVFNINGFTARLSGIVAALKRRRSGLDITVEPQEPALRFPLVSDRRFRAAFAFTPAFGLEDVIDSVLEEEHRNV